MVAIESGGTLVMIMTLMNLVLMLSLGKGDRQTIFRRSLVV